MNRTGESGQQPDRNPRFFQKDGYWYYATREGVNIGPFDNLQAAGAGASAYIDFILHAEPHIKATLHKYQPAA